MSGGAEGPVELDGAFGLDEHHRPLDQVVLGEEVVGGVRYHVDQGIADTDHLEARGTGDSAVWCGHVRARYRVAEPAGPTASGRRNGSIRTKPPETAWAVRQ